MYFVSFQVLERYPGLVEAFKVAQEDTKMKKKRQNAEKNTNIQTDTQTHRQRASMQRLAVGNK